MTSVIGHLRRAALLPDGGGLSDGQLLESFLTRREEAAFEALVRRHGPMVWGVCQRMLRNRHDAEDAFQATFLVLVRKAASILPRELVGHWLYGVAYRTSMKARTMSARRRARERDVPRPEAPADEIWQELIPLLDRELNRLPDKYRVPVVLCELEGRSRKEVARQLNLPEGTLSSRLATARKMLAKHLSRDGLTVSTGALAALLSQNAASASVPTSLTISTTQAAFLIAGSQGATTGVVSAQVYALVKGVMKAMFLTKLKISTALVLTVGLVGSGVILTQPAFRAGQPNGEQRNAQPNSQASTAARSRPEAQPDVSQGRTPKPEAKKTDTPKTDWDRLPEGTWQLVSVERNGVEMRVEEADLQQLYVWDREGDKVMLTLKQENTERTILSVIARYKLDPTKKPKAIDLMIPLVELVKQGKLLQVSPLKTLRGIYSLKGAETGNNLRLPGTDQELKLCLADPDQERPNDFVAKPNTAWTLYTFEHVAGSAGSVKIGAPKGEAKKTDTPKTDRDRLPEGTWQLVSVQRNGRDVGLEEADLRQLYGQGDKVIVLVRENATRSYLYLTAHYKLDPTNNPKAIDLVIPSADQVGQGKTVQINPLIVWGKTLRGIYSLKGYEKGNNPRLQGSDRELKLCLADPDQERPNDFVAKPGTAWTLYTFEHVAGSAGSLIKEVVEPKKGKD